MKGAYVQYIMTKIIIQGIIGKKGFCFNSLQKSKAIKSQKQKKKWNKPKF